MRRKTTAPVEKILLRVAIYIRVSTDKQVKDGDSMRDQLATGQKYIDSHENMILVDTYIDDGISGQKLKRDDFQRLIDDVRAGRIDLIIFTRLDRWFRNLRHYLNTQDILDKHGVSWTAIEQPYFDTSTPHGRAFVNNSMIYYYPDDEFAERMSVVVWFILSLGCAILWVGIPLLICGLIVYTELEEHCPELMGDMTDRNTEEFDKEENK